MRYFIFVMITFVCSCGGPECNQANFKVSGLCVIIADGVDNGNGWVWDQVSYAGPMLALENDWLKFFKPIDVSELFDDNDIVLRVANHIKCGGAENDCPNCCHGCTLEDSGDVWMRSEPCSNNNILFDSIVHHEMIHVLDLIINNPPSNRTNKDSHLVPHLFKEWADQEGLPWCTETVEGLYDCTLNWPDE